MNDFNVYKLIWTAKTSSKLSQKECEQVFYQLSKIKLIKDKYVKTIFLYLIIDIILMNFFSD